MSKVSLWLVVLFLTVQVFAQTPQDTESPTAATQNKFNLPPEKLKPMRVPRFEAAPAIDGKLDDAAWRTAGTFKDFFQTSPGDNVAPSKPTIAYIGYDELNLYFAFHCFDEPDKIRATVAKRDEVFGEDNVRIFLDTYNDQRRAYIFGFNPLGIQADGIQTEDDGADYSVDIVMESKGALVEDGWVVEVKIPFKSLRYGAGDDKLWGIQLWRNIDRFNDEIDSWMPQDRNNSSFLGQAGKITGLKDIKVERTLELIPSITLAQTAERVEDAGSIAGQRFAQGKVEREIGLNLKYSITPNITLDAAFNPDFAEIEADAPVVTANQRFPIFFAERRPFFLEGVDIFQSPLPVVYTRTIENPDIAAKLTGKIGKNSFGVLTALDNESGTENSAMIGVLRLKRDVGKQNQIGFFGTARKFNVADENARDRENYLGGFDGRFRLSPQMTFDFQAVGTNSKRFFYNPDLDRSVFRTGNGFAYSYELDYTERDRGFVIEGDGATRDYRADVGFTRRTNTNRVFFATRLSTAPKPKNKIIRTNWNVFGETKFNWQARSQEGFLGTGLNFALQGNASVGVEGGASYERLFEDEFGARRSATQKGAFLGASERSSFQPYGSVFARKTFSKKLSVSGNLGFTINSFDFDFGGGGRFRRISPAFVNFENCLNGNNSSSCVAPNEDLIDPGTGKSFNAGFFVEYKPVDPLRISLNYTKSKLTRDDTGRTAFDANIATLRSTYQFSRFTFARARFDYDSISSSFSGQMLLGYNPNPGTAFYVGYNDNFNYNGFNPFTGEAESRFERNSRTFFIRASYLFRKSF